MKYDEAREPGLAAAPAATASAMPRCWVMSPALLLKVTTSGGWAPVPNVLMVRWFAS